MISNFKISEGDAGTRETVQLIRGLINQGRKDINVRRLAENLLSEYPLDRLSPEDILSILFDYVKKNISYLNDPVDVEFIRSAPRLLSEPFGDCDDYTVLLGSLAESVGIPIGIKVIDAENDNRFHHVYPVALLPGRQLAMDATMPGPEAVGYESPSIKRSEIYREDNGMRGMYANVLSGLGREDDFDLLRLKRHPDALNDWESDRLYRLEGRKKPRLTDVEQIHLCRYAENARHLYECEALSEMCRLRSVAQEYKPKGKVVPRGTFVQGEFPSLTELDRYGVRNWIWPGLSESPDPEHFKSRLMAVDVKSLPGQPDFDEVSFAWKQIPLSEVPSEPPPPPPIGYDIKDTDIKPPSIFQPPPDMEADPCLGIELGPGQLLLSKGLFNEGDILNTLWGSRFAATSPSGKITNSLSPGQAWALYVTDIQPCSADRSVYTAEYRLVEVEPEVSAPDVFEPRIFEGDIAAPDPMDLISEFMRLKDIPSEARVELPTALPAPPVPTWALIAGGLLLLMVIKK